jgi:hypothetical protein
MMMPPLLECDVMREYVHMCGIVKNERENEGSLLGSWRNGRVRNGKIQISVLNV